MFLLEENNVDGSPARPEPAGFGRCLSQGAAVGVVLGFTAPVDAMISDSQNGYNFLLAAWLPIFLFTGMVLGVIEGALLWAVSYITGGRLHAVIRVLLATLILTGLILLVIYIYFEPVPPNRSKVETYFSAFAWYLAYGVVFGLTIGSRFRPLYELGRGGTPPRWPVMSAITGSVLRIFVIFALMEAILFFIWVLQRERPPEEFGFAVVGLIHFALATVILFVRMPFWLLLPLSLLINFPIAALLTDVLQPDQVVYRTITLNYLALWGGFLLCRFTVPRVFSRAGVLSHKRHIKENLNPERS